MTTSIRITFLLLTLSLAASAQMASKTFTKSFNNENRGTIILDLPGAIDIKVWDNPTIRFEIGVEMPTGRNAMLNELANIGRYNLVSKTEEDALTITAPNLQKTLKVKGEELPESVTFVVFVPKNMKIELPNATASAEIKK